MQSIIRNATLSDLSRCAELLAILFSQEKEFEPNATAQLHALTMIAESPASGQIFVAEVNGKVEGMVLLLFTISTYLGKRVALLEDMIVAPEWRGKGIGSQLLHHALAYAQSNGMGRVTLLTDLDNEAGHQFYKAHGFVRSSMVPFRYVWG